MTKEEIAAAIGKISKYQAIYREVKFLPEPFCKNTENVKAIVLGCDPSNKREEIFKVVFGLDKGDEE